MIDGNGSEPAVDRHVVTPIIVIGFDQNGQLFAEMNGNDRPSQILMLEKVKMELIATTGVKAPGAGLSLVGALPPGMRR